MKRGQFVSVCYDGKYSRRVKGEVIKQHNGHHISVKFIPWDNPEHGEVIVKFRKRNRKQQWEGFTKDDGSIHTNLFGAVGSYFRVDGHWIEPNKKEPITLSLAKWYYKKTGKMI